jgi:hypothetical protein
MERLGNVPLSELMEAIAMMGLKEAIDHNTDTQQDMVSGLAKICAAINALTDALEKK